MQPKGRQGSTHFMNEVRINLYSDTQTRPTPEMRAAMAAAECHHTKNTQ